MAEVVPTWVEVAGEVHVVEEGAASEAATEISLRIVPRGTTEHSQLDTSRRVIIKLSRSCVIQTVGVVWNLINLILKK